MKRKELKTYLIEFVHWNNNQPKQIKLDCTSQLEALTEFKKYFGKVNFQNCTFANFNMRVI